MIVGTIAHEVLEKFISQGDDDYSRERLKSILKEVWQEKANPLVNKDHYDDIEQMLDKWFESLLKKTNGKSLNGFMQGMKTELKLDSKEYNVRGIIDLVDEKSGSIIEYKTSVKNELRKEHKIQVGIYALLFLEKFKRLPKKLVVHFLKHGEKEIAVDKELLNEAKRICKLMKLKTLKKDVDKYPRRKSGLCKWKNGECDFYGVCFGR